MISLLQGVGKLPPGKLSCVRIFFLSSGQLNYIIGIRLQKEVLYMAQIIDFNKQKQKKRIRSKETCIPCTKK